MNAKSQTVKGIDFEANRLLIVKATGTAQTVALATDPTTEQPCGVIIDYDQCAPTWGTIVTQGDGKGIVGAAGIALGHHLLTCDAASKLIVATAGDNVIGYVFAVRAYAAGEVLEFTVDPRSATIPEA